MQKLKTWQSVEFEIDQAHEDLVCWVMMQLGSIGCQIHQLTENKILVSATFAEVSSKQLEDANNTLKKYGLESEIKNLCVKEIPEEDWLIKWKENLRPLRVGKNFLISPPWFAEEIKSSSNGEQVIYIEPGMAFGTGLHATTQYCLCVLEDHQHLIDILDVGTGSGILAIAVAKLNPQARIVAVEINPDCVEVARQNIILNGVEGKIILKEGSTETCTSLSFDCIVANLSYEDNANLLLEFLRLLRPAGRLVLAGILAEKLKLLKQAIERYPLAIVDHKIEGEWVGVTLERIPVKLSPRATVS